MSLIAHYKLDGNALDSSGYDHNGISYNINWVNGKIGQSGEFNGLNSYIIANHSEKFRLVGNFSLSFWYKIPSLNTIQRLLTKQSSGGSYGYGFNLAFYNSNSFLVTYNNGDNRIYAYSGKLFNSNDIDKWFHVIYVWNGIEQKYYIDGVDVGLGNHSTTSGFIGGETSSDLEIGRLSSSYCEGSLDDIRIYDHALSTKEIKELAKGKVLHYTFDDFQEPTENLYEDGNYASGSFHPVRSINGEIISDPTGFFGGNVLKLNPRASNQYHGRDISVISGDTYSASVWCYVSTTFDGTGTVRLHCEQGFSNSVYYDLTKKGEWQYLKIEGKVTTSTNARILTYIFSTFTVGYVLYRNLQFELKDHATPFTQTTRSGLINDVTGNGNNAELALATTPQWVSDSKIGSGGYYFNGINNGFITPTTYPTSYTQPFTISTWVYVPSSAEWSNGYSGNIIGRGSYAGSHGLIRGTTNNQIIGYLRGTSSTFTRTGTITRDSWNHCAFVNTGSSSELFINGISTGSANHTLTDSDTIGSGGFYIGFNRPFSSNWGNFYNGYLDDSRIYATALSSDDILQIYQSRHSLDNHGNFFTPQLNETGHKALLLNYTVWQNGQTGTISPFSQNGSTSENSRVLGIDPWGKETVIWEATPDDVSGADGGWSMSSIPIDNTKTYRFSTWVWRNNIGNGNFYLGCNGYGSINGVHSRRSLTPNTNPYFYITTGNANNEWELVVGHVWAANSGTGSNHPDSGRYTVNDGRIGNISVDYVWLPETTTGRHRSYLYYCTDTSVRMRWVYPRMDICDGTEPSIQELLSGFDSNNIDLIRTIGGTTNLNLKAGSKLANIGEISEVGITNGLVAYYPLDNNTRDYSGNNYHGTVYGATLSSGIIGGCYSFDGVDDKIKIDDNLIIGVNKFSVSCWFMNKGNSGTYRAAVHRSGDASIGASDYWIGIQTGNYIVGTIGANSGIGWSGGQTTIIAELDTWYHVIVVWDGTTVRTYVNGNLEKDYTLGTITHNTTPTRIGASSDATNYVFNGLIDDVRIYNRALTPEEVGILYEMGTTNKKMKLTKDSIYLKGELKEGY